MIVNGRPYSNENGYIDDKLITDRTEEVIEKVYDWIKKGFIKRKTPSKVKAETKEKAKAEKSKSRPKKRKTRTEGR